MRTTLLNLRRVSRKLCLLFATLVLCLQFALISPPSAHAIASTLTFFNPAGQQPLPGLPAEVTSVSLNSGYLATVGSDGHIYPGSEFASELPNGLDHVAKAYIGRNIGFAIKDDGTLWSWGDGVQLGRVHDPENTGQNEDDPNAGQIVGLPALQNISVGSRHVLALDVNGHVWAWGDNYIQQLGINTDCPYSPLHRPLCDGTPHITPIQVPGLSNIQSVQAGLSSSLAVTDDGTPLFWGTVCSVETFWPVFPTPSVYPGLEDAKQVLTDDCSITYLTNSGEVYSFGFQGLNPSVPLRVDMPPIESISTDGRDARVAVTATGTAYRYTQIYQETAGVLIGDIGQNATYLAYNPYLDLPDGTREQSGVLVADYPNPADLNAPLLGSPAWANNPKATNTSTTLTIPATDDASGIARAEYFIGDTDPGTGNGATMTLSNVQNSGRNVNLTTTFGTNFPTGVYKISVRAQDVAGNWSLPVSDYLVVYDPAGPKFTGKRTVVPSFTNGDILPGLIAPDQTDKANFGFSVKYNNQGQINANSDFQFSYNTGTKCNNPAKAVNCHAVTLNATSISWLATQGTNNSTGIFQGNASLVIDGTTSTVAFRATGLDGSRLSPTASDQFEVQIFTVGSNPNIDTPLYKMSATNIAQGNIKIN